MNKKTVARFHTDTVYVAYHWTKSVLVTKSYIYNLVQKIEGIGVKLSHQSMTLKEGKQNTHFEMSFSLKKY